MITEKAAAAKRFAVFVAVMIVSPVWYVWVCLTVSPVDTQYTAGAVPNSKNGRNPGFRIPMYLTGSFINPKG